MPRERLEPADIIVPVDHGERQRLRDGDGGRRRRGGRSRAAPEQFIGGEAGQDDQGEDERALCPVSEK